MNGTDSRRVVLAGALLGIGLGGFADGILLHQILQWHNMLSSRIPPTDLVSMKINMLWDGIFHAFTWIVTAAGVAVLWRAGGSRDVRWSTRAFAGALVLGWGLFNLVEGVVDHQLLGVHHVHPGANELAWDVGFLVLAVLQLVVGVSLIRSDARRQRSEPARVPGAFAPGRA
jgi:uncharacterized membrane protein